MAGYKPNPNQGYNRQNVNRNLPQEQLPAGYLKGGYFKILDGEKVLKTEYIIKYPKDIVQALTASGNKLNKRSQIRKFYEYALGLQGQMQRNGWEYPVIEAELNRLLPYAAYAKSRNVVSDLFEQFIKDAVSSIHDKDDFNAFIKHFEAIIAYLPKDNN